MTHLNFEKKVNKNKATLTFSQINMDQFRYLDEATSHLLDALQASLAQQLMTRGKIAPGIEKKAELTEMENKMLHKEKAQLENLLKEAKATELKRNLQVQRNIGKVLAQIPTLRGTPDQIKTEIETKFKELANQNAQELQQFQQAYQEEEKKTQEALEKCERQSVSVSKPTKPTKPPEPIEPTKPTEPTEPTGPTEYKVKYETLVRESAKALGIVATESKEIVKGIEDFKKSKEQALDTVASALKDVETGIEGIANEKKECESNLEKKKQECATKLEKLTECEKGNKVLKEQLESIKIELASLKTLTATGTVPLIPTPPIPSVTPIDTTVLVQQLTDCKSKLALLTDQSGELSKCQGELKAAIQGQTDLKAEVELLKTTKPPLVVPGLPTTPTVKEKELEETISDLKQQHIDLESKLQTATSELKQTQIKEQGVKAEKKRCEDEVKEKQSKIEELQKLLTAPLEATQAALLAKAHEEVNRLSSEIKTLKEKNIDQENIYTQVLSKTAEELKKNKEVILNLETELNTCQAKSKELTVEKTQLETETNKFLEKVVLELKAPFKAGINLQDKRTHVQDEIKKKVEECEKLAKAAPLTPTAPLPSTTPGVKEQELQAANAELKRQNSELAAQIASLTEAKRKADEELKTSGGATIQECEEEKVRLKTKLKQRGEEYQTLENDKRVSDLDLRLAKEEIVKLQGQKNTSEGKLEAKENEIAIVETKLDEMNTRHETIIKEKEKEIDKWKAIAGAGGSTEANLVSKLNEEDVEMNLLNQKITDLTMENVVIKTEKKQQFEALEEMRNKLNLCEKEVATRKTENENMKQAIEENQKEQQKEEAFLKKLEKKFPLAISSSPSTLTDRINALEIEIEAQITKWKEAQKSWEEQLLSIGNKLGTTITGTEAILGAIETKAKELEKCIENNADLTGKLQSANLSIVEEKKKAQTTLNEKEEIIKRMKEESKTSPIHQPMFDSLLDVWTCLVSKGESMAMQKFESLRNSLEDGTPGKKQYCNTYKLTADKMKILHHLLEFIRYISQHWCVQEFVAFNDIATVEKIILEIKTIFNESNKFIQEIEGLMTQENILSTKITPNVRKSSLTTILHAAKKHISTLQQLTTKIKAINVYARTDYVEYLFPSYDSSELVADVNDINVRFYEYMKAYQELSDIIMPGEGDVEKLVAAAKTLREAKESVGPCIELILKYWNQSLQLPSTTTPKPTKVKSTCKPTATNVVKRVKELSKKSQLCQQNAVSLDFQNQVIQLYLSYYASLNQIKDYLSKLTQFVHLKVVPSDITAVGKVLSWSTKIDPGDLEDPSATIQGRLLVDLQDELQKHIETLKKEEAEFETSFKPQSGKEADASTLTKLRTLVVHALESQKYLCTLNDIYVLLDFGHVLTQTEQEIDVSIGTTSTSSEKLEKLKEHLKKTLVAAAAPPYPIHCRTNVLPFFLIPIFTNYQPILVPETDIPVSQKLACEQINASIGAMGEKHNVIFYLATKVEPNLVRDLLDKRNRDRFFEYFNLIKQYQKSTDPVEEKEFCSQILQLLLTFPSSYSF